MLGAIAGDIIGSPYEFVPYKNTDFPLFCAHSKFTDDTVLTIAVADALLHNLDLIDTLKEYSRKYPDAGYGGSFKRWVFSDSRDPYNSWGNGSAMRTSPIGFFYNKEIDVLKAAKTYAQVTHNHPEGIRGAQATSLCIFLARHRISKSDIRKEISKWFNYDLSKTINEIRPNYYFDVSCQGSVPQSIIAFLESDDYEDAIRKAVSLGGDADTMACIAGGIAEAFYGPIPENIALEINQRLPDEFLKIIDEFYKAIKKY
ncbi:MAG: ADP-ribosylglycohydrolase family protein [Anaerolineaceae bacterium]|nr:ADP-ribosylglycohydrolase family protein [Anaerolineaceae bacterium]